MDLSKETKIGKMEVRNHFLRSATFEGAATEAGFPTEAISATYRKLANGGVGTIITSFAYISAYEQPQKNQLAIYSDDQITSYQKLTSDVHDYGAKIVMQIVHGSSLSQGYPERARILGPSSMKHPASGLTSQEMTEKDIQNVIRHFANAALRVKASGFDGVQIHCAHGYLLAQFLSPLFNHRTDKYGGPIQNRIRIVEEVYQAIRTAVGEDYPVWIKMNTSDEQPNGLTVEEFLEMAMILSNAGIDAIEVSGEHWHRHKLTERAYYKEAAMQLSKSVDTPIILTGGLRELSDLTPIYENSKVDLFGFARPFMKNPNFIKTL